MCRLIKKTINKGKKTFRPATAWILCCVMLAMQLYTYAAEPVSLVESINSIILGSKDKAVFAATGSDVWEDGRDAIDDLPLSGDVTTASGSDLECDVPGLIIDWDKKASSSNATPGNASPSDATIDGKICIYTYEQLCSIGSDQPVYAGMEEYILDEDEIAETASNSNADMRYSLDADYYLMNDIALETERLWNLPEGFCGTITPYGNREDTTVYDEETDTIYLYNIYQLYLLNSENAENELVMTGDWSVDTIGMGQVFTLPDEIHLTYGKGHHYVLASDFAYSQGSGISSSLAISGCYPSNYDGRAYFGEVVRTINGKDYILIGNEKQLRAIGSNKEVTEPIWQVYWERENKLGAKWKIVSDNLDNPIRLYYPGDADLIRFDDTYDWSQTELYATNPGEHKLGKDEGWDYGALVVGNTKRRSYYSSMRDASGALTYAADEARETGVSKAINIGPSGATYSNKANYIIFRDIDLGAGSVWTPIKNFTGTMEGRLGMQESAKNPTISHVNIEQTEPIDQSADGILGNTTNTEYGVGFFRDLVTSYDSALTFSDTPISVSNLTFDDVSVSNTTSKIDTGFSLLGALLKPLLALLGLSSGLEDDPRSLATGSLAGVVRGNVEIRNCKVTNLQKVSNVNDWTGGLVGSASGITKYSALSGALGTVVDTLSKLLNIVPVLGLGDLVTVLLGGGVLEVKNLIPVGYTNAIIEDCSVSFADFSEGVTGKNYTGGLAGEAEGAVFMNCMVESDSTLNIEGADYTGGVCGRASNAVIAGLLSDLGIDLMGNFPVNAAFFQTNIMGMGKVNVTSRSAGVNSSGYAGGFIGAMSHSYAVDCGIQQLGTVTGKNYVGGFAGKADMGNLADIEENKGLLGGVTGLLTTVLTGKSESVQLLSLAGLRPSVITGAQIEGDQITITASGDYAGGMVGYAGAVQISNTADLTDTRKTTATEVNRVLDKNGLTYTFENMPNLIKAADSITITGAGSAGGLLGKATMTSVSSVLGQAITAADYMRFELRDTSVDAGTGGMMVQATAKGSYAGGVIGHGVGGEVRDVSVWNLKEISASDTAGGFAGFFGSGTLASAGGINLLGINLLKVDGLLSVGKMIETFSDRCLVAGLHDGFTVTARDENGKSGGFIGYCVSGKTTECSVKNVRTVTASGIDGKAGGFIGYAKAGDALATVGDQVTGDKLPQGVELENLLGVVSALTPEFGESTVSFVTDNLTSQISADWAGGFIGDGEAVQINVPKKNGKERAMMEATASDAIAVDGLTSVSGRSFAGGFAGRIQPGDVAQTGSVKLLGLLEADQLLSVMNVAYPAVYTASVSGNSLKVEALGAGSDENLGDAGGYIGSGKAITVVHSSVSGVESVKGANHAGGYIGVMRSGTAAEVGDGTGALLNSVLGKIIDVGQLVSLLQAASCKLTDVKVSGTDTGFTVTAEPNPNVAEAVSSATAGGFVGEMQSGTVDNSANAVEGQKGTAAENLKAVSGLRYAGGFGGLVKAGAVAELADGSALLTQLIDLTGLLSVVNAFVPKIRHASVHSAADGFTVTVTGSDTLDTTNDSNAGSAGGFIGYGCGVQIGYSDVNKLANTVVQEPANLQADDGSSYYGSGSSYSVSGYRHAGGYFGKADIGSTAAVGGAGVLSKLIQLGDLLSALNVVVSIVEYSDVYGAAGGFNIRATSAPGTEGKAGGFAGIMLGTQIQDCNSYNFAHIIGRESAGGYAGTIEPGSVGNALGEVGILSGLISADNLLGVLRTFVPTIKNSETTCIPCGGAVRAEAESSSGTIRGLAGGYLGYNFGGQVWGCSAKRIRSVYGTEYAGGYTGLMKAANVADTGNLTVLKGIISIDNPLTVLQAVYPTEEYTAVTGPLRGLDMDTWNQWVTHVGAYGSYGQSLIALGTVGSQEQLDRIIETYAYGYDVTAGREGYAGSMIEGSAAGGYVGRMESGTVTLASASDVKSVDAFRSSGGFAGEMITGSVANAGGISLAGIDILGNLPLLQSFVPVIKRSSVTGYQSGAEITATGNDDNRNNKGGIAGGYVGRMVGGQIWGQETKRCSVTNLRRVDGRSYVGGFVGQAEPGSIASLDTSSDTGLLNQIMNTLIKTPADLAKVLSATVATIRCAEVEAWDDWGVIVNGAYQDGSNNTAYARAAGGFAGSLSGTVVGELDQDGAGANAYKIRNVVGGEYAGGFFGLADVASVLEVSAGGTSILGQVLTLGATDVLDTFRTYVYGSTVTGSGDDGLTVSAAVEKKNGTERSAVYSGDAGGFGGALLDGSVKNSRVSGLKHVSGLNYTGGFVGYGGKSGVVDVDKLGILGNETWQVLGGSLGVLDVFGSNIHDCTVTGIPGGYRIRSGSGTEPVAGGFIGFGDLARIVNCTAGSEALLDGVRQVASDEIAGGFAGKTSFAYLGDVQLESTLVDLILKWILNPLIRLLYLHEGGLASGDVLNIQIPGLLTLQALYDGNLLSLTLLGLTISVGLSRQSAENQQETDVAIIRIGDSTIKLPCTRDGIEETAENKQNISITLIKANRTKIEGSRIYGTKFGYDVYGGGAGDKADGISVNGYSGGFVGYNREGLLESNSMYYCDVVRGTEKLVGPFTGKSTLDSAYGFNTADHVEGNDNQYRIYRDIDTELSTIKSAADKILNIDFTPSTVTGDYNVYTVKHVKTVETYDTLKDAVLTKAFPAPVPFTGEAVQTTDMLLQAYETPAKAVLMRDASSEGGSGSLTPPPPAMQDPCDEFVHLTVNKVWRDHDNRENTRPGEITVTLTRSWTDCDNQTHLELVPGYENYRISGDKAEPIWQAVLLGDTDLGFPAYKTDEATGDIYYYTYSVTETEIPEYSTDITVSEDDLTFTITNSHFSVMPDTGGAGVYQYWIFGAVIISALVISGNRKKRRQKEGVSV